MFLDMRVKDWKDGPFLGFTKHVRLTMLNSSLSWYPAEKSGWLPAENSSNPVCSMDGNHHLLFYDRGPGESEFLVEE